MKYIKQFENFTTEGIGSFFKNLSDKMNRDYYFVILPENLLGTAWSPSKPSSHKEYANKGSEVWHDTQDVNAELKKCNRHKLINGKNTRVCAYQIFGEWNDDVKEINTGYGILKVDKEIASECRNEF